jgi:ribonuclease R
MIKFGRKPKKMGKKKLNNTAENNNAGINSILDEYDLPLEFDEKVLAEADTIIEGITEQDLKERKDMRNVLTFTIDPEDAKDFDDALSIDWVDGNIQVGVHIADVSHYVRPRTEIDKEAYRRGTSIYLVDRVIHMLPEKLSNKICSLRPNEDKLCFSVIFTFDKDANVLDEWFGKTIINSNHRYTYETAQEVIENKTVFEIRPSDVAVLNLNHYAKKLRKRRMRKGSITFDKEEVKFKLDEKNNPIELIFKVSKDANKLIEEFMLLANQSVARILKKNNYPVVSRVHEEPSPEKLSELKNFIKQFGYDLNISSPKEITRSLNKLLIEIKGKAEENLISNLVVRTMQKAFYTTKDIGHYGLGFDDYSHFTSPIRRYPDLITHRLLGRFLTKKTMPQVERLEQKCVYLSVCEQKAQKAERDSIKYMQTLYLSDKVGRVFNGIITSITDYGIFVQLIENKCDGMIRINEMQNSFYADLNNYCVKNNSGSQLRLGDEVAVIISSVDIERKNINFKLFNL